MIYRNTELSFAHWIDACGFDISYPNYSAYKDAATLGKIMHSQNENILDYACKNNAEWENLTTSWIEKKFNRTLPESAVAKYASKFGDNGTTITLIK